VRLLLLLLLPDKRFIYGLNNVPCTDIHLALAIGSVEIFQIPLFAASLFFKMGQNRPLFCLTFHMTNIAQIL